MKIQSNLALAKPAQVSCPLFYDQLMVRWLFDNFRIIPYFIPQCICIYVNICTYVYVFLYGLPPWPVTNQKTLRNGRLCNEICTGRQSHLEKNLGWLNSVSGTVTCGN